VARIYGIHEADSLNPSKRLFTSDELDWKSVLVRGYENPAFVEEMITPRTSALVIVLVTEGSCDVAVRDGGRWREGRYVPGDVGMTAPLRENTLRWTRKGRQRLLTTHIYIPTDRLNRTIEENWRIDAARVEMPDGLKIVDPVLCSVSTALDNAASATEFLTMHLLATHLGLPRSHFEGMDGRVEDARVRRAIDLMYDRFREPLSLDDLAAEAAISRFHFLRMFRRATGVTPHAYLLRIRLRHAERRLAIGNEGVGEIAIGSGFESPAHFAAAFRRFRGLSPTKFRAAHQKR
jgi:AraC family transcriptional regulator